METGFVQEGEGLAKIVDIHLRLDEQVYRQYRVIARKEGRTATDVLREAIARYLMLWNHAASDIDTKLPLSREEV